MFKVVLQQQEAVILMTVFRVEVVFVFLVVGEVDSGVNSACHPCRYTCRGLFEIHKLLFSFQMCVKILEAAGKLNMNEYNFFLRGGIVRKHKV